MLFSSQAGKSAICLAASKRCSDVLNYLLEQKLDHDQLIRDKAVSLYLVVVLFYSMLV